MNFNSDLNNKTGSPAAGGILAALYVLLTLLSALVGLSSLPVQLRLSEMLCIMPCFTPAAVPALFVGCLLANLLTGAPIWDVIFGSLATLLGAWGTRRLRRRRWAASLPPILANTLILPFVLSYAYHLEAALPLLFAGVALGELLSAGVLGQFLYSRLEKHGFPKI